MYSGDRLALCVGETDINLEHDPQFRHLSHQWNQAFERTLCDILLLQSRAKMSPEERDYIEETIEIILSDLEEIQVRLQFLPDVTKTKLCETLKTTVSNRRSRVGHIFGIPSVSSELTSLVCSVQENLTETSTPTRRLKRPRRIRTRISVRNGRS